MAKREGEPRREAEDDVDAQLLEEEYSSRRKVYERLETKDLIRRRGMAKSHAELAAQDLKAIDDLIAERGEQPKE